MLADSLYSTEPSNLASNLENIALLNRVRLVAIIGQIVLIAFSIFYLEIQLPLTWLVGLILVEITFQIYCLATVNKKQPVMAFELLIHIVIDSIILAGLVYFSGGANNPFIYLLLVSVALGSFMLSARYLLAVAILQVVIYSILNLYQRPLELGGSSPLASFHLHLAGMWVNFILTVILISIFGFLARFTMLKQQKQIQVMREKHLQDEQVLALGIMSASAAHELGTPLSTMANIIDDLQHSEVHEVHEIQMSEDLNLDIKLLDKQIKNCTKIIQQLSDKSYYAQQQLKAQDDNHLMKENFKEKLQSIIEHWLVYRPQITLKQNWNDDSLLVKQGIMLSVEQAIINLLDNAADACLENKQQQVELSIFVKEKMIVIDIQDFGLGLSIERKKTLGVRIQQSSKQDGLGWGIFLSNASIERVSGKVQLLDGLQGGTLTRITLPIEENNEPI